MGIDGTARKLEAATPGPRAVTRRAGPLGRASLLACAAAVALALTTASASAAMPHASLTVAPITGTSGGYVVSVVNTGKVEMTGFEFVAGSPESPSQPKQLVPSSACAYKGFIVCNTTLQPGATFQMCYQGAELSSFEVNLIARLKPEGEVYGVGAGENFRLPAVAACPVAGFTAGSGAGKCTVPKLAGKTQSSAESAIKKAGCKVGSVKKKHSSKVKKGRVISQGVGAGKSEPSGTKVSLVVSKGK